MRVDNVPGPQFQDAVSADQFLVGNFSGPVSGLLVGNNMNQNVPGDTTGLQEEADILLNETCFLQRFPVQTVAPGATRQIAHYIRSSWSTGDYKDPFMMVLDAPLLSCTKQHRSGRTCSKSFHCSMLRRQRVCKARQGSCSQQHQVHNHASCWFEPRCWRSEREDHSNSSCKRHSIRRVAGSVRRSFIRKQDPLGDGSANTRSCQDNFGNHTDRFHS